MTVLAERVIHSYLTHIQIEVIARMENISVREVERIVGRAVAVPRKHLRLEQ